MLVSSSLVFEGGGLSLQNMQQGLGALQDLGKRQIFYNCTGLSPTMTLPSCRLPRFQR